MSARTIPVACVQTRAYDRAHFDARWPHVLSLVDAAGLRGAQLAVLPEGSVPAYLLGMQPVDPAQLAHAAETLGELAARHRMTIVYGAAKIVGDRTVNAAIAIGPDGSVLGHAAKQFLWHFDRRWFAAGTTLDPIDTPLGRLGLFVCADGRIPTIAATLVDRGAQLLVMPTAWVTSGRDPATLENIQADLMASVRARENGVPFVVSNKVGVEAGAVAYCGKSSIVAADGSTIARGHERDETIVFGDVVIAERRSFEHRAAPAPAPSADESARAPRARIAFTTASDRSELARFAELAALADADVLITNAADAVPRGNGSPAAAAAGVPLLAAPPVTNGACVYATAAGVRAAWVDSEIVSSPRGLVAPRMAGIDLFLWLADGEAAWATAFARTRAAELRAYVVVFDRPRARAYVVDPDGVVLAGTFDDYRMASFAYDRARAAATLVAPQTDVARGLQIAEDIRFEGLRSATRDSALS